MLNFTILIFFIIIVLAALWLSAKFLGKTGLYVFAGVNLLLCSYLSTINVSFLSAAVEVPVVLIVAVFLTICIIYKKYGLGEGIKITSVAVSISLFNTLLGFLIALYAPNSSLSASLNATFLPFILSVVSIVAALGLGLFISEHTKLFAKFNDRFKNYLIFCGIMLVNTILFTILSEIGVFSFGQILLNFVVTYLIQIIVAGIIFMLPKKLLNINENSNFDTVLKNKFEKVVASTKKTVESATKKEETVEAQKEPEEEQPEVVVEDKKE